MLTAKYDGRVAVAWRAERGDGFTCPECEEPVYLKRGEIMAPHFAHYPSVNGRDCSRIYNESVRHVQMKLWVMISLENASGVEFEQAVVPGRRADIVIPAARIAVECQSSSMTAEEWEARTREYTKRNWAILWIWDSHFFSEPGDTKAKLPSGIRACHRYSYGHVNVCDPETREFYEVSLSRAGSVQERYLRWKHVETASIAKVWHKDARLRTVALIKGPWWK